MPRQKRLNTIYISERLQEKLRPIAHSRLTTVVAPMGYGKTTAVNWYLAQRTETEDAAVIRISVYSDNLAIFWRSVQEAFDLAGVPALRDYDRPADDAGASLLADGLCRALAGARPCYIFIDDFHLLSDRQVAGFLCTLAGRCRRTYTLSWRAATAFCRRRRFSGWADGFAASAGRSCA